MDLNLYLNIFLVYCNKNIFVFDIIGYQQENIFNSMRLGQLIYNSNDKIYSSVIGNFSKITPLPKDIEEWLLNEMATYVDCYEKTVKNRVAENGDEQPWRPLHASAEGESIPIRRLYTGETDGFVL